MRKSSTPNSWYISYFGREEYSEDFEEDVEESSQKETAKKSPQRGSIKKGESPTKQQSPKTKLDFPEKGLQKDKDLKSSLKDEEFKSSKGELGSLGGLDKEKKLFSASLDAATLERIELEECLSELRSILKKKRVLYLQFCEEKVVFYHVRVIILIGKFEI
jgi:hypothetical protein